MFHQQNRDVSQHELDVANHIFALLHVVTVAMCMRACETFRAGSWFSCLLLCMRWRVVFTTSACVGEVGTADVRGSGWFYHFFLLFSVRGQGRWFCDVFLLFPCGRGEASMRPHGTVQWIGRPGASLILFLYIYLGSDWWFLAHRNSYRSSCVM
jgi:hypothetical protein